MLLATLATTIMASGDIVTAPLDELVRQGAVVSAVVTDMNGRVLVNRNAETRLMPASNQKLLSNAFALDVLGARYKPKTKFWVTPEGTYIYAEGDPLLSASQLEKARLDMGLAPERRTVLRQAFRPGRCDSWQIGDAPNRYAPTICAFTINQGGCELWNDNGTISIRPDYVQLTIRLVQPPNRPFRFEYDPFVSNVSIYGTVPAETKRLDTLAIPDPDITALSFFGRPVLLETRTFPDITSKPTYEIEGKTTAELIGLCLPPSDNQIAETLMFLAAKQVNPNATTFGLASSELQNWLVNRVGLNPNSVRVADGSGISRKNNISADAIAKLLRWSAKQPTAGLWKASMALPGQKGTLSNRLVGVPFAGKTGSLDMVACLSGYVKQGDGRELVVSVLVNHFPQGVNETRDRIDRFIKNVASTRF